MSLHRFDWYAYLSQGDELAVAVQLTQLIGQQYSGAAAVRVEGAASDIFRRFAGHHHDLHPHLFVVNNSHKVFSLFSAETEQGEGAEYLFGVEDPQLEVRTIRYGEEVSRYERPNHGV